MMNDWYQRMVNTLQLNGKGERTQQAYTRSVGMLSQFYGKTPDLLTEQELQEYFLQRKNVNDWSPKTMRICYCGIRFFYEKVLDRNWHILSILRAQNERRLPAVLSVEGMTVGGQAFCCLLSSIATDYEVARLQQANIQLSTKDLTRFGSFDQQIPNLMLIKCFEESHFLRWNI